MQAKEDVIDIRDVIYLLGPLNCFAPKTKEMEWFRTAWDGGSAKGHVQVYGLERGYRPLSLDYAKRDEWKWCQSRRDCKCKMGKNQIVGQCWVRVQDNWGLENWRSMSLGVAPCILSAFIYKRSPSWSSRPFNHFHKSCSTKWFDGRGHWTLMVTRGRRFTTLGIGRMASFLQIFTTGQNWMVGELKRVPRVL